MKRILFYAAVLALASVVAVRAEGVKSSIVMKAGRGDLKALRKVFEQSMQEQPRTGGVYEAQLREVLSSVGTDRFTRALYTEPSGIRSRVMYFLNIAMSSH